MSKSYYVIQSAEKSADIYIFGDIVPVEMFKEDVSAKSIVEQINRMDVETLNVYIDSYGGAVSEGWAIYNALRKHPATVNTYGCGFVASAALYPFLAGDNRYASNLSAYYLHQVMISVQGYPEELRTAANEAEMFTDIGINAFVERTNMDEKTVRDLMENETWLTPMQALEYGIATSITTDNTQKYTQSARSQILQQVVKKHVAKTVEIEKKTPEKQTSINIMSMFAKILND